MPAASLRRMFLSHNFTLPNTILPALSRPEFVQVFADGLATQPSLHCRPLDNAHWIVAVSFDEKDLAPHAVGQLCVEALALARGPQLEGERGPRPKILALGGTKTTPATSDSADTLQLGDWGVDVVETLEPESFLAGIQWDRLSAGKSPETVFKIEGQV